MSYNPRSTKKSAALHCRPQVSWSRGADLNHRPSGYEPDELTRLLHPAMGCLSKARIYITLTPANCKKEIPYANDSTIPAHKSFRLIFGDEQNPLYWTKRPRVSSLCDIFSRNICYSLISTDAAAHIPSFTPENQPKNSARRSLEAFLSQNPETARDRKSTRLNSSHMA